MAGGAANPDNSHTRKFVPPQLADWTPVPTPMRWIALALLAALTLAPPAMAKRRTCERPGTKTIVRTASVRVFEVDQKTELTVYGCLHRRGRAIRLGSDSQPDGGAPSGVRASGHFVAFERVRADRYYGHIELDVRVVDLTRRRRAKRWVFQECACRHAATLTVRAARLKANGSYAFLVGPYDEGGITGVYGIFMADRSGRRELDRGADIDPGSFVATPNEIRWTRAGTSRSAPFR